MNSSTSPAGVEFSSARLLVRSIRESDQELYCELFSQAETMRHIGPPWTRAAAAKAFRSVLRATRCEPPRAVFLTLTPKAAQQAIGLCSLQNFDSAQRTAELGLMIVPSGRAHGVATEALTAVIAHTFSTLPFDELWVRFAIDHAAAKSTARSAGLVRHADASPQDRAANLWRWSAYRSSWRPAARAANLT
ncbi:MAG TPA: GNAT family N-acetyltransferase [Steroidobacteraceae bacterium]|nr:GNAT family N-acetyltransferase [Steroidobacteraceae bacterium]